MLINQIKNIYPSLTDKDFREGVADTTSLKDNIHNFSLAAKGLNKELLLQSFCNMFNGSSIINAPYAYEEFLKGFLYTLCNVGTRRDLVYILDRATLKETVLTTLVKKPEVEPLWMDYGKLNYKYFVDEPFISAADKNAGEGDKPDTKRFVDNLWLLWLYKNTKEQDVNKIKQVLLNLYKELGAVSIFRVSERYISNDIHYFINILTNVNAKNTYGVTRYFNLYIKAVKPDLLDIPKEVLEYIVHMERPFVFIESAILSDLRSNNVTKIANAISVCVTTSSFNGQYLPRSEKFITDYFLKKIDSEYSTSESYSNRLANLIRAINNPKQLNNLFEVIAQRPGISASICKLGLEQEFTTWKKCKEAEEIAKKALEESLSKKIEEPVTTSPVGAVLPYTIEDVNVTKELLSLEGTQSGRVSSGSPNNTSETGSFYSEGVLPEKDLVEPEKPRFATGDTAVSKASRSSEVRTCLTLAPAE